MPLRHLMYAKYQNGHQFVTIHRSYRNFKVTFHSVRMLCQLYLIRLHWRISMAL